MKTLEDLKVGDEVVITGRITSIATIERITATQFVMSSGLKYRRKDGGVVNGGDWDSSYINFAISVEAVKMDQEKRKLLNDLVAMIVGNSLKMSKIDIGTVKEMIAYFEERKN